MLEIIDVHSHINLKPLSSDIEGVVSRMKEKNIGTITVGVDFETSKQAVSLAEKYPEMLWATIGLHPTDNMKEEFDFEKYLKLAENKKVLAVGECGLDYFRDDKPETKERQKKIFMSHVDLAERLQKPLMIHSRPSKGSMDAYEDVIKILTLRQAKGSRILANFHFFVGDLDIAKQIVERGWTVSYDGPITFSRDYDEVIKWLPIENIMAETDAPFAAPAPYRGKTCEPFMVPEIIKKIAEIKEIPLEIMEVQIRENVKRVFGI